MTPATASRARDIKAIHAMRRELALSEDCYRARVSRISGGRVDSSVTLTGPERAALIAYLRRLGVGAGRKRKANTRMPSWARIGYHSGGRGVRWGGLESACG